MKGIFGEIKVFFFVLLLAGTPNLIFSAQYGDSCDPNLEFQCIPDDFRDPLECFGEGITEPPLPTTEVPTTEASTTEAPTTKAPTTEAPTTEAPTTEAPTTEAPTTKAPTTEAPTTEAPTTEAPTTEAPTTEAPTTEAPTTEAPTTEAPTTAAPTTEAPTTEAPTTEAPTTAAPTTEAPTTAAPTTEAPTTAAPTTEAPTTEAPTTEAPTTEVPTTEAPTTEAPTTKAPTTEATTNSTGLDYRNIPFAFFRPMPYAFNAFDILSETQSGGTCGCKQPTVRHFGLNRCLSPPGKVCDQRSDDGNPVRTCTQFAQCYPGSSNEGICHCDSYATPDDHRGVCALKYGSDKCTEHEDCDTTNGLACFDGVCLCRFNETQRWSETRQSCVNVHGGSCRRNPPLPPPFCVDNANCVNNICLCNSTEGYIPTPEKECKLDFDHTCEADEECHPSFICSDALTCTCPSGQVYFQSTKSCHITAGSECNAEDQCTLHSACLNDTCTCVDGYEAQGNICQALHGSPCSSETPCHEDKFLNECQGQGVCECLPNYEFNEADQRCKGNLNEKCSVEEDCVGEFGCVGDLCKCKDNRLPHSSKCYSGYHQVCTTIDCHPELNFKCNTTAENGEIGDYTCVCKVPSDQIFEEALGNCVALAGKPCEASKVDCVGNAECTLQNQASICQCVEGYGANPDGFCEEGLGSGGDRKVLNIVQLIFTIFIISFIK